MARIWCPTSYTGRGICPENRPEIAAQKLFYSGWRVLGILGDEIVQISPKTAPKRRPDAAQNGWAHSGRFWAAFWAVFWAAKLVRILGSPQISPRNVPRFLGARSGRPRLAYKSHKAHRHHKDTTGYFEATHTHPTCIHTNTFIRGGLAKKSEPQIGHQLCLQILQFTF